MVGRIATDEACLVPHAGQMAEEALHLLWLGKEALRTVGQMLQAAFEEHRQRQLVGVACDVRMLRVAEGAGRIVHGADDVAGEGQCGVVRCGLFRKGSHVVVPLSTVDAFCRHQVGPCALPSAGNGGTVEVHQQVMTGSALQQVDAVVHVLLCVAAEEVNLHAGHTNLLTPRELFLAVFGLVQAELRAWCAVDPSHAGVVPYHRLDAMSLRVVHSVDNGLAILHLVPLGIDEHVGQTKGNGQVDILADDVIVVGTVIVGPVNP